LFGYFGPYVYPVLVFALGTVVQTISLWTYPSGSSLVGASGVVYLMAGSWLTLFVFIERRFSLLQRLLRSIGFALVMLLSSTFDPSISYRTHWIGLVAGVLLGLFYFLICREKIRAAEIIETEIDSLAG